MSKRHNLSAYDRELAVECLEAGQYVTTVGREVECQKMQYHRKKVVKE